MMSNQTQNDVLFRMPNSKFSGLPEMLGFASPYVGAGIILLLITLQLIPSRNKAPIINPKKWTELTWARTMREFAFGSKGMLQQAFSERSDKPFQVYTSQGMMTVLGPKYAQELRNEPRLDFGNHIMVAFNGGLPGFDAFDQRNGLGWFMVQIAQKHLTTFLNSMTKPMSDECDTTLKLVLNDSPTWHSIDLMGSMSLIIARMSSRIFLGQEFVDDEKWIASSLSYAVNLFAAQERLSLWPSYLRPIAVYFLPYTRSLMKDVSVCRNIIETKLKARRARQVGQEKTGDNVEEFEDTLEWMHKLSKKGVHANYDPTKIQLSLSMAAIHTTNDMTSWLLLCLTKCPEIIQPLREEIVTVLKAGGWKKTSLYNLRLLDSVMKESQRLKPNVLATMRRLATADITLSDGSVIPKGTMTLVSSHNMRDPVLYPDPDRFDPYRFYNMRQQPGKENHAQFVTTSPEHLGFSHGQHSCPGRFFAANEIKILLCHFLLKYDFRLAPDSPSDSVAFGFALIPNPMARLEIRRRKEEIDLNALGA